MRLHATDLKTLAASHWDRGLGDEHLYLSTPWLSVEQELAALDETHLIGTDGRDESQVMAGFTVSLLDAQAPPWPFARLDRVLLRLASDAGVDIDGDAADVARAALPTLLCGGRRPGYTGVAMHDELSAGARARWTSRIVAATEELARDAGARSVSLLYVEEHDRGLRDALGEAGFVELPSALSARLELSGATFEDYLQHLKPKRRSKVRHEQRQLEAAGVSFEVRALDDRLIETIVPLELALYRKYGGGLAEDEVFALHRAVARCMPDRARVLTAEHGGRVRGFVVLIRWGSTLYARQGGFDYDFQGRLPLYFGVVFYAAVEHALATGMKRIEYGIGSAAAKASRGCHIRRQFGYVKVFDPAVYAPLERLAQSLAAASRNGVC